MPIRSKCIDFLDFLVYEFDMLADLRRPIYAFSNKIFNLSVKKSQERLTADFSKIKKSPFNIKAESFYNANLLPASRGTAGSLELALKKTGFAAWLEIPDHEYGDHVIEAKISLDSLGGYAAAGVLFHLTDNESYYIALVSSKGYFRVDVVKDNSPRPLIAWTEISDFDGTNFNLKVITYGTYLIFLVNGKWAGETNDDTLKGGQVGFVLVSYDERNTETQSGGADIDAETVQSAETQNDNEYTCKAHLKYISINSGIKVVEENFKKWTDDSNINAESRLHLAETFAVMGNAGKAMEQINKAWKQRDDTIRGITAGYSEVRTKKELLLAVKMSILLEHYEEAEEFVNQLLDQWEDSAEGKEAAKEKILILKELRKFGELKEFLIKHSGEIKKDTDYYVLLARCYFELKKYKSSAAAWDKAFKRNSADSVSINGGSVNGVYAANAANAYELAGKNNEAFERYLEAGKIFLNQDNLPELSVLIPKLLLLGDKNWEARVLAGKWAFSLEDYNRSEAEFAAANKLRNALKPRPKADPAHYYLWGLVLYLKGRNKEAIRMIEKAVKLAPDYELFTLKLAELKKG